MSRKTWGLFWPKYTSKAAYLAAQSAPLSDVLTVTVPALTAGQTGVATVAPVDANGQPVSAAEAVWSVTAPASVASIDPLSGQLTVVSGGTRFEVVATIPADGRSGSAVVGPHDVASITITPSTTSLEAGATLALTATPYDSGNAAITGLTPAWSSSDPSVATVHPTTGVVTGVAYGTVTITVTISGVSATRVLSVISAIDRLASFRYRPDRDGYAPATIPSDTTFNIQAFYAQGIQQGGVRLPMPTGVWARTVVGAAIGQISAVNNTGGWTWTDGFTAPTDGGADSGPYAGTRAQGMVLDRRRVVAAGPESWATSATGAQRIYKEMAVSATLAQQGKPWVSGVLAIKGVRAIDAGRKFRLAIMDSALTTVYAEKTGTLLYDATARGGWTLLGVEYRLPALGTYEVVLEFDQAPEDAGTSAAEAQTQVLLWGMGVRLGRLPRTTAEYWAPWSMRPAGAGDAGVGGEITNPLPIYPGLGLWTSRQSKNHLPGSDNWYWGNTWRTGGGASVLSSISQNDTTYGSNIQTGDAVPTAVRFPVGGYLEQNVGGSNAIELKGGWSVDAANGLTNLPGAAVHPVIVLRSYNGATLPANGELVARFYRPSDSAPFDIPLSRETWWAGDAVYTGRGIIPASWTAQATYIMRYVNAGAVQRDAWVMAIGLERDGYNAIDEAGPRAQPVPVRTSYDQTTGSAAPGSMLTLVPASSVVSTRQGAALFRVLLPFDPYTYNDVKWTLQLTDTGPGGSPNCGLNVSLNSDPTGAGVFLKAYWNTTAVGSPRTISVQLPITALGQFPARQQFDLAVLWDSARDGSNNPIVASFNFTGWAVGTGAGSSAITWNDSLISASQVATGGTDWEVNAAHRLCPWTDQDHRLGLCGFGYDVAYVKSACPSRVDVESYFASMGSRKQLLAGGVVA